MVSKYDTYSKGNFNPRTHRGVRPAPLRAIFQSLKISIHAPIVGCDLYHFLGVCQYTFKISIHAPIVGCDEVIQFTFPSDLISIHAPIVGCDCNVYYILRLTWDFNPRTHRGVRQRWFTGNKYAVIFQSTHPSWGATLRLLTYKEIKKYFNPRTHRGVRP